MTHFTPATEADAIAIVTEAAGKRTPLAIMGGGTKAGIGRPAQTEATLSSRALTGITLYEPSEMVIGARAGTPLSEVERTLAEKGQRLPFEPMDWRVLMGSDGEPTMGGLAATNTSGPRRIMAGACRDSLIGVRFVNGRGEAIKSGGRVMKNVTGLDLVKLVSGAWGTLGFLTEVTFKVLPLAERTSTLVVEGLSDARGVEALCAVMGSPFEATGVAHLPAGIGADKARTLVRIEGFSFSVDHRLKELTKLLAPFGRADVLEGEASAALWRDVRDVRVLAEPRERAIWRLSVAPTDGPGVVAEIARTRDASWFYDWSGGLVWLSVAAEGDAGAAAIRAAVDRVGGHATLVRAPADIRARTDVFEPLGEAKLRLTRGIKSSFDPAGLFEPGRMYAGV
jgi:glycolate oxidase FAD binding subunit